MGPSVVFRDRLITKERFVVINVESALMFMPAPTEAKTTLSPGITVPKAGER